MVYDHLISRVKIAVAMEVIGAIKQSSSLVREMLGHGLSQGLPVAWGQSLAFDSPEGCWLNSASMKS